MMRVISLGAGVQSTTMALMAAHGEIGPMPDCAIFADTGAEPEPVYEHLRWLMSPNVLPFPVHVVSAGNIADDLLRGYSDVGGQSRFAGPPFFIKKMKTNGASFDLSMGRRQCTRHYKIDILAKAQRKLLGYEPRARIPEGSMEVWIGISLDEAIRAKPARHKWQINRHPLLELRITRKQCLEWLDANGYMRPPKSACTFCPYRDDAGWKDMKENDPKSFEAACDIDDAIRNNGHMRQWRNELFVHRSLKPLREVEFSNNSAGQIDMFLNECEGMCGV
jgi:hypothetical protein